LTGIDLKTTDKENVIRELQNKLEDRFGKASGDDARKAAVNIYR